MLTWSVYFTPYYNDNGEVDDRLEQEFLFWKDPRSFIMLTSIQKSLGVQMQIKCHLTLQKESECPLWIAIASQKSAILRGQIAPSSRYHKGILSRAWTHSGLWRLGDKLSSQT